MEVERDHDHWLDLLSDLWRAADTFFMETFSNSEINFGNRASSKDYANLKIFFA